MKTVVGMFRIERLCFYAAWLLYATPSIAVAAWASRTRAPRSAVAVLMTFVLVACLLAAITRTWRRFFLVQYPFCLLGVVFATYTLTFGIAPGHTLAGIVVATSSEEVRGFIGLPQGRWLITLLVVWSLCYLASAAFLPTQRIFSGRGVLLARIVVVLLVPVAAYTATNSAQLIDGIGLQPVVGSLMFLGGDVPEVKSEMRGSQVHKIPYRAQRSGSEEVHVLVVGESARRDSWSVYGYDRPTTPYLDSLKNKDEAIFLQHAMADANLTSWAVPILLTGMTPDAFEMSKVRGNIFDLAKEGGYYTAFLANQDVNISAIVGVDADLIESPLDFSRNINGRRTLDGQMLPAFRRELARGGKSRFIGIHMMGSHWEYFNRYPADFQHFGTAKQIGGLSMLSIFVPSKDNGAAVRDSYDNTVLYTDWFLQQVIEQARKLTVPATVTFFPDHGEDLQMLDRQSGHGQPVYTQHAFEIPAFVWANDAYRKLHPDIIAALKNNSTKEIRTHNLFYTVADLMGIKWPEANAARSFASASFVPEPTMQYIAGGVLVDAPQGTAGPTESGNKLATAH
jgi:glucan phosphoethanolaminetransferase (alkaline phosphatase superfamily)